MLTGKRILLTGPVGSIGFPLATALAKENEVWGISRFGDPAERARADANGIVTRAIDLSSGDFGDLPDNFDYVLHLAAFIGGDDFNRAIQVNAEGTALLMAHCRRAKAFLSMSTTGVYRPNPDPWHKFHESEPLGDAHIPRLPYYSLSKIVQEGTVRACARILGLPTIIARMNAAYGDMSSPGGVVRGHFNAIREGRPVVLRYDPNPYSLIHDRDIFLQSEALLEAASTTCPIVNWGGDEAIPAQSWCAYFGEALGVVPDVSVQEFPGAQRGVVLDNAKRLSLTGPCTVAWRDGLKMLVESAGTVAA